MKSDLPWAARLLGALLMRKFRLILPACLLLLVASMDCMQAQTVINYPGGFSSAGAVIDPIDGAVLTGSSIQMTQTGSQATNVWYQDPVNVEAFTTTFTFNFVCPATCGDGIGFILISPTNPKSPAYWSGDSGAQLSWSSGCTTPSTGNTNCVGLNSVMVKFNLYDVTTSTSGANLTGLYTGGEYPQPPNPEYDMSAAGINMESGDVMSATLAYNGTVLTETVTDTVTKAAYSKSYTVNIPSLVGGTSALVGFGAGTGADSMAAYLDSWTYTEQLPGQASAPTFSPAAGTYTGSQNVTLASASTGAVICYNASGSPATDGAAGCKSGARYANPVSVPTSETLYAVAGGAGYSDSPVVDANYVLQTAVTPPTFSPAAGTYTSAQSVVISDTIANAIIYYSTDGTTPTTSSNKYVGPVTVSASETLKAIAVASGAANSTVATAAYTINLVSVVATPQFSPPGGAYTTAQTVTLTDSTAGATIYYTTDGTMPSSSSTKYTGPIEISSSGTVSAIGAVTGETNSAVATAVYTISALPVVARPAFLPTPGVYATAQTVTITDSTNGATIYYTTDGTTPTTASTRYTGPVAISSTETIQAIAALAGDTSSGVALGIYIISSLPVVATPTFTPGAGAYPSAQSVTILDTTPGATIYYSADGSMPTTASTKYSGPITVTTTQTLQAIAVVSGYTNSSLASAAYTIGAVLTAVATPTFSPVAGPYTSAQTVTISDTTAGASIYYTVDGSIPTTLSTVYTGPITVSKTETVQAVASAAGDSNSAIASAAYTITPVQPTVATPTFSPAAGSYTSAQSVTISESTAGATIFYTTDGTKPTTNSAKYAGSISVATTTTILAIAAASGDSNSAIASATYTIVAAPSFTLSASPAAIMAESGGSGNTTLTVTPQNGFNAKVSFACSGLPVGATCTFNPATLTPTGGAPVTTGLTISAGTQASVAPSDPRPWFPWTALALMVGTFGLRAHRRVHHWFLMVAAFACVALMSGCGGGGSSGGSPTSTTSNTPTQSAVTVTATSGSEQVSTSIALTIN